MPCTVSIEMMAYHFPQYPHLREERAGGDGCSAEWDLTGGGRNDLVCRGSLTLRGKVFALGVGVKRAASPNIQTGATWM